MDRSDTSQPACGDPPTEKTQPTGPASAGGTDAAAPQSRAPPAAADAAQSPEQLDESASVPPLGAAPSSPAADAAPGSAPAQPAEVDATQHAERPDTPAAQPESVPSSSRPVAADAPVWAHGHPDPLVHRFDVDRFKDIGVRAAKVAAIVFCAWLTVALLLIAVFRFVNPPVSALMVLKWVGGTGINQDWVPLSSISPNLVQAVIASEDDRFCSHWGIDYDAIAAALRRSAKGTPRGASTITMQVSKNLFLWPSKSYVRKLLEVPLTYAIELAWPKRRILEVYLNIAEWGPGIFGAEAASQAHFGRPARRLSARQAALLAVSLPNPHARNAGRPGPWASRRATVIQRRATRLGSDAGCVLAER